jgi:NitT/TauT family transport system permease protein
VKRDDLSPAGARRAALSTIGLPIGVGVLFLLAWQIAVRTAGIPQVILPAPTDILASFHGIVGELARHAYASASEALVAFLLATLLGLGVAILLCSSTLAFEAVYPHLVLFQLIPKIALAPLFTFWLGIAAPSRITYATFISFFPVALATMTGLARADANVLRLCRALMASRRQTFFLVQLPYSLPYFFSGAKVAATMAVIGIVVGEFISAKEGLGYYILYAGSRGETAHIFAAMSVLCAIGLLLYGLTVLAERMMQAWWRG